MIWLDLDVEPAPDTGTPSVEAHWGAVNVISYNYRKEYKQVVDTLNHHIRLKLILREIQ